VGSRGSSLAPPQSSPARSHRPELHGTPGVPIRAEPTSFYAQMLQSASAPISCLVRNSGEAPFFPLPSPCHRTTGHLPRHVDNPAFLSCAMTVLRFHPRAVVPYSVFQFLCSQDDPASCMTQLAFGWSCCDGLWAKNRPTGLKFIILHVFVYLFLEFIQALINHRKL
jgi:hypothetical protein